MTVPDNSGKYVKNHDDLQVQQKEVKTKTKGEGRS